MLSNTRGRHTLGDRAQRCWIFLDCRRSRVREAGPKLMTKWKAMFQVEHRMLFRIEINLGGILLRFVCCLTHSLRAKGYSLSSGDAAGPGRVGSEPGRALWAM